VDATNVVHQAAAPAVLQLAAQQADEDGEAIGGRRFPVPPDPVHDQVVAEHLLGIEDQQLKQRELDLGEANGNAVPGHGPVGEVEREVGIANDVAVGLGAA
jgi:hypothetical protein